MRVAGPRTRILSPDSPGPVDRNRVRAVGYQLAALLREQLYDEGPGLGEGHRAWMDTVTRVRQQLGDGHAVVQLENGLVPGTLDAPLLVRDDPFKRASEGLQSTVRMRDRRYR